MGIINNLLARNKPQLPSTMTFNNVSVANNDRIAERFGDHFCSVASSLDQNLPHLPFTFEHYMPGPVPLANEVSKVIKSLKNTSPGHDNIDIKSIKDCCNEVSPQLSHIINKSFIDGIFPHALQIARVVPIFQKGDTHSPTNFRPVSVLSVFSKIVEKIMIVRFMNYLSQHSLLSYSHYFIISYLHLL